jgi:glycosyltransferase involved in cell wall biosynthesis
MKIPDSNFKVLICLVCYEAEKEILNVLKRIPQHVWNSENHHILISDDASKDRTAQIAYEYLQGKADNVTIQKLDVNQGYGGNQKACYLKAVQDGYDGVIFHHLS